ncbi:MAG: type IV secretion system DNA-binding domain-containing protein [Acetobacteraceae bacterium]|nr:type IV secretion system DNA-binding domain-containing protein [Acetobacteraceae bacterium]
MRDDDQGWNIVVDIAQALFRICFAILKLLFTIPLGIYRVNQDNKRVQSLATPQRFTIAPERRFAHTHIIAGSGHGKTQTIQHMIAALDFEALKRGERSVIVMDSQGDLINTILRLSDLAPDHPSGLAKRLVLIDPTDIDYPPCLNLFDFGQDRAKTYSGREQEKLVNGTIAIYEYLFGALLGAELTSRQEVVFRYLARLLLVIPGATIYTLIDCMREPALIRPHLIKLEDQDPTAARFLETQVFAPTFDATRQQIVSRLWNVLSTPAFERMFSHEQNKLNMFAAMNAGSLILINTAKEHLQQDACQIFGKFMIALITQATLERGASDAARTPTFVYIDEAQDYFDQGLELLLNQARKYQVGLILAHQNLGQLNRSLLDSITASTAVKFAGGVSAKDAKDLAPNMATVPEMIMEMRKRESDTRFAIFVKDQTQMGDFRPIRFTAFTPY